MPRNSKHEHEHEQDFARRAPDMLGRLLQTAATTFGREGGQQRGQQTQPAPQLESVTEEAHTRDLLYPDVAALRTSQHSALPLHAGRVPATPREAANYDDSGGLDISYPHDIRVLIAQDANAKNPAQLLFDSRSTNTAAAAAAQASGQEQGPSQSQMLHARGKSMTSPSRPGLRYGHQQNQSLFAGTSIASPSSPLSPELKRGTLLGGQSMGSQATESHRFESESLQSRLAREKEEVEALLSCIFGSPGMRLESGTKLHVLPKNFPNPERGSSRTRPFSPGASGHGQRAGFQRSATSADMQRPQATPGSPYHHQQQQSRVSVMITKLFNVHLPEPAHQDAENLGNSRTSTEDARPSTAQSKEDAEPQRPKQKKTPMYAIAIVIQLPIDHLPRTRSNPTPAVAAHASAHYQLSAPNSPRSTIHIPAFGSVDGRMPPAPSFDANTSLQITFLLSHWGLVCRNLRLLELMAQKRLRHLLEHLVPLVPLPVPAQSKAGSPKLRLPKVQSQQVVYVSGDALQDDLQVRRQVDEAALHISLGLRAKRVVPGQGRWGAWREEARWIGRWAGSKEQSSFFFVFITAFLGQHTEWLEHVAPRRYASLARRRRMYGSDDFDRLPQRTVIICKDKMTARRLVFLAASFLPASLRANPPAFTRPSLMSESYSESPPALSTTPREQQSRRGTIRGEPHRAAQLDGPGHARSVSFSIIKQPLNARGDGETGVAGTPENNPANYGQRLTRRPSEAGSVRSVRSNFTNLPTSVNDSNKAISSAILADSALPVAHFTTLSPEVVRESPDVRPSSNGSMASFALNSALRRSESSTAGSTASFSGKIGSMMSGFWSAAPESSTDGSNSDLPTMLNENSGTPNKPKLPRGQSTSGIKSALKSPTKLTKMVEEASYLSRGSPVDRNLNPGVSMLGQSPASLRQPLDLDYILKKTPSNNDKTAAKIIPTRNDSERMFITLNMNEDDGFVDVEMPEGMSVNSSLASSFASLRMSSFGYSIPYGSGTNTWNSSGDISEHQSPYGSPSFVGSPMQKPESPPSVAGWLKTFHPDFVLQAVRPYPGLDLDMRQALEAEARLHSTSSHADLHAGTDEWSNICGVLVVDTTKFSVERHTLQRRLRMPSSKFTDREDEFHRTSSEAQDHTSPPFLLSPSSSIASLHKPEPQERVIVEPMMDMDQTLIDAIDRVLAQSGTSSRAASCVPSRAPSPSRLRPVSVKSATANQPAQNSNTTKQDKLNGRERAVSSTTIPGSIAGNSAKAQSQVPFPECRKIIMGALEEVVSTVIEDRDRLQPDDATAGKKGKNLAGSLNDGTLRLGVSQWLSGVEQNSRGMH